MTEHRDEHQTLYFTVDAALLRELGERLVGKPHVALAELIKNAYDADARCCRIRYGRDTISVLDDGHGMDFSAFKNYWMRIGSTHKETLARSPGGRPLTGSKGVGRLAVQFLARYSELRTTPITDPTIKMVAEVNWEDAQSAGDLVQAKVKYALQERERGYANDGDHGFEIVLSGLRHEWTNEDFGDLAREIWMLRPPFATRRRDASAFDIQLETPFKHITADFNRILTAALDNWQARVTCSVQGGPTRATAHVKAEFKAGYGRSEEGVYQESVPLPVHWERRQSSDELEERRGVDSFLIDRLEYDIRIYKLAYRQPEGISVADMRKYLAEFGGVHIYDEGFRLPFYDVRNDWLRIEYDHAHRLSASPLLPAKLQQKNMMQDLPTTGRIFGIVQIGTREESGTGQRLGLPPGHYLTINPGRDRLVNNEAYVQLRALVRWGIDYYVSCYRRRRQEDVQQKRPTEPPDQKLERLQAVLAENRGEMPVRVFQQLEREVYDYIKAYKDEGAFQEAFFALLGPLATAGMVSLALNHEMARQLSHLDGIVRRLGATAKAIHDDRLAELASELASLSERVKSMRRLFAPLANEEDRREIHRLQALPVLRDVRDALGPFLGGVDLRLSAIPPDFRLPPAPYAEWNALFQNVLINAINALLDSSIKRISVAAGQTGRRAWIRISDTGVGLGVPLHEANQLFDPFQRRLQISAERRALGLGGQGLGLTIVRMIAENRDARVAFVEPEEGYSTTFEVSWSSR